MRSSLPLARRPTPLERLARLSEHLGVQVDVKRDDLTGVELTGNKVRKLEVILAEALQARADVVITCGGVQSNHCRATAAAARKVGLHPVLLLRGERSESPDSNLLLDQVFGAELHFCTPDEYRSQRGRIMADLAAGFAAAGRRAFVIPEGGSNGAGAWAYARAAEELAQQTTGPYDAVFAPVGSGGTLAGLALGPDIGPIWGVAVCDDRAYFSARVKAIAKEAEAYGLGPLPPEGEKWRVVEGYQGAGYGIADAQVWNTVSAVARWEGLLLDPVYTGKAMCALFAEAKAGRIRGKVLFWHTGGAFGLFGRGAEFLQLGGQ